MDRFGVALGSLFAYETAFGSTLWLLWGHFGHIDVVIHTEGVSYRLVFGPSGPVKKKYTFLRHFLLGQGGPEHAKTTKISPSPGRFGARLGSLWVSDGDFRLFLSLDDHFEIIVESPWVYEGPLSKNIHFPNRF